MLLSKFQKEKESTFGRDRVQEWGVGTVVSCRSDLSFGSFISRKGVCEEISGAYEKTGTDGKFLYHKSSKETPKFFLC